MNTGGTLVPSYVRRRRARGGGLLKHRASNDRRTYEALHRREVADTALAKDAGQQEAAAAADSLRARRPHTAVELHGQQHSRRREPGTLRWAISQANANNQADTIAFSSLFNTPQTIKLTGGYSPLTLDDSATTTISGPGADLLSISGGGATKVFDISGSADLSGLTITGGYGVLGGGLSSAGATALSNCTISGNSAVYSGGGILNADGTMMLTSCTITGNHAARSGGGVYNGFSGTMALINCTISANGAGSRGGGLGDISSYSLTLTNCTVTGNAASDGGGLSNPSGPTSLTNTIVAGQEPGGDIFGSFSDSGGNLIGGDPLLAPLGDYGGPTPTMPLLPGSPAIGKGTSGPGIPTTDQRRFAWRLRRYRRFQTQGSASFSVNVATDGLASGLGQLDLRQAINLADVEPDAPISFAPSVFGTTPQTITLTAGELTLTNPGGNVIGGPGAGLLTVSGNNVSRVFYDQGVSADLSGLTITGGNAPVGGGLDNDGGFLSLTGCTITGNVASDGGGLDNDGGTLLLTNCTIMGNTASDDGGGLASSARRRPASTSAPSPPTTAIPTAASLAPAAASPTWPAADLRCPSSPSAATTAPSPAAASISKVRRSCSPAP